MGHHTGTWLLDARRAVRRLSWPIRGIWETPMFVGLAAVRVLGLSAGDRDPLDTWSLDGIFDAAERLGPLPWIVGGVVVGLFVWKLLDVWKAYVSRDKS